MPYPPGPILLAFINHFIGFYNSVAGHLPRYNPWREYNAPPYQTDAELDVLFHTLEFKELLDAVTAVADAGRFDDWPPGVEAAFGAAGRLARELIHEEWKWDPVGADYGALKAKAKAGRPGLTRAKENVDRALQAVVPQEKEFAEAERRYLELGHSATEPDNEAFKRIFDEIHAANAPLVAAWENAKAKHEQLRSARLVGHKAAKVSEHKFGQLREHAETLQKLRAEIERRADAGQPEPKPEPPRKRPRPANMVARNQYAYEQVMAGSKLIAIKAEIKARGWGTLNSLQSVTNAAHAHADDNPHLPRPPGNQSRKKPKG